MAIEPTVCRCSDIFLEKMDTENQLQITVTIQIYPLRKYF